MSRDEIIALLRESFRIEVKTTSEYTGGDPLYSDCHTIQLIFDNEVISEATL